MRVRRLPAARLNSSKEGRAPGRNGEVRPDWASPETGNFTSLGLCFFSHQALSEGCLPVHPPSTECGPGVQQGTRWKDPCPCTIRVHTEA